MRGVLITPLVCAFCLGSIDVPAFASEADPLPLAPSVLRQSIELEARQLVRLPTPHSARPAEAAVPLSPPNHKKTVSLVAGVAALTLGTICLSYGYSGACGANNVNDSGSTEIRGSSRS
jgi:hypothetical protein